MNNLQKISVILTTFICLNCNYFVSAQNEQTIEMTPDTSSFNQKILQEDNIKISVDYRPFNYKETSEENNIKYKIYAENSLKIEESVSGVYSEIYFENLDNNKTPEIIVQTYSGGAHCCTSFIIYTWLENKFVKDEITYLDGGGGVFKDLDKDGNSEFITSHNGFLYLFSSYAGSYPPSLIYSFNEGKLKENTRNYPDYLREREKKMLNSLRENQKRNYEVNGILAGYVAQKILLGEYQQGWEFMLKNYDKNSDWGLTIYNDKGEKVGKYPDFPTALRAFLFQQEYLK